MNSSSVLILPTERIPFYGRQCEQADNGLALSGPEAAERVAVRISVGVGIAGVQGRRGA